MAIDCLDPKHRERLARSVPYWHRANNVYNNERKETIGMYAGSRALAGSLGAVVNARDDRSRTFGNLIQMDAQAMQVLLAYGEPRWTAIANLPRADAIAPRLQEFLNRYSQLLNMGDFARSIALDSYFGYGIGWVDNGRLPAGVRSVTGQEVGPMIRRVSQNDFGFDGDATCLEDVAYFYRLSYPALDEAQEYYAQYGSNPDAARKLEEYTLSPNGKGGSPSQSSAQPRTRLIHLYIPSAKNSARGVMATWPANDLEFAGIAAAPLMVEEYKGHHTGPVGILSHLDIPDHLVSVARCESTKRLHILYNELGHLTSEQAKDARYNPLFEVGGQRDIQNILTAKDRAPVGVNSLQKLGSFEVPGPSVGQMSYMNTAYGMFNELAGNPKDVLGLGQSADTAKGSMLVRQATNASGADKQRRMYRFMDLMARKLAHLALNDQTLYLPIRSEIPGTEIQVDMSWLPPYIMPREPNADDYAIELVQESLERRSPQDRLAQFNEATGQIFQAFQLAAQGVPIELPEFVELQANYRNLPEIRKLFAGLLPFGNSSPASGGGTTNSNSNKPNGQYTRTNVSERTDGGALQQAMTQFDDGMSGGGGVQQAAE